MTTPRSSVVAQMGLWMTLAATIAIFGADALDDTIAGSPVTAPSTTRWSICPA
jgi:hypothetical protein